MKRLMLGLAIVLGGLSANMALATTPVFSPVAMGHYSVDSLGFSDIIHELYRGQTSEPHVDDDRLTAMPFTQLGYGENGEKIVAMMHPVVTYKNTTGERRYLVMIEKVKVSAVTHKLMDCHVCAGTADLFIFKKLRNGSYQLVSRTPEDMQFAGSWGRVQLDLDELKKSIQPLGNNLMGGFIYSGYTSMGISEAHWDVLHLAENDYINVYFAGDAGGNNLGYYEADSPRAYDYEVSYQVKPNNSKYYPIQLTYKGTKENYKARRVDKVNDSDVVRFNPKTKSYE